MGACCSRRRMPMHDDHDDVDRETTLLSPVPSWGRSMARGAERRRRFGPSYPDIDIDDAGNEIVNNDDDQASERSI